MKLMIGIWLPNTNPTNVSGGHVGEQMETTREESDENEEVSEVRPILIIKQLSESDWPSHDSKKCARLRTDNEVRINKYINKTI